ncbi:Bifunctional uridylyltransferase/uridylyl-removing enzyme [Castellaniella denitrificans]
MNQKSADAHRPVLAELRARMQARRDEAIQSWRAHLRPDTLLSALRRIADDTLRGLLKIHPLPAGACAAAVGGYGRGELYPGSDLDILILLERAPDAAARERIEALQILAYAPDRPDLFMDICTYFDRHGLSIQDARIHTTRQGWALDSFIVLLPEHDRDFRSCAALIEHELRAALGGGPAARRDAPAPHPGSRRSRAFPIMPSVTLQPDEQGGNWRLSVTAADRVGLLHDLARVFARHDVGLKMAKIMTLGDRVEDIFVLDGPGLEHPRGQMQFERQVLEALGAAADTSLSFPSTNPTSTSP